MNENPETTSAGEEVPTQTPEPTPVVEPTTEPEPTTPAAPVAPKASSENPNFISVLISGVIKPMATFKEHLPKFSNIKNAAIISLIVVAMATLLSTVTTVVGIVRTEKCVENCKSSLSSLFSSSKDSDKKEKIETKWEWDNLKNYDWFKNVGQTFLFNMLTVLTISGAFFGISKAFKSEKADFGRMLAVVAIGLVPMTIVAFLAPMIGAINVTFAGILNTAAIAYSFSIILIGLNEESGLEGDKKVYLNIASLACIVLAYYIVCRFMLGDKATDLLFKSFFSLNGGGLTGLSSSSSSLDLLDL